MDEGSPGYVFGYFDGINQIAARCQVVLVQLFLGGSENVKRDLPWQASHPSS